MYHHGNISVDRDFARFGAKSYAINKINTVEVREEPAKTTGPVLVGIVGLIVLLANIGDFNLTGFVIGAALLALAVYLFREARPTFKLFLMTSSSEVQAFETQDKDQVMALRDSVEAAMIGR